MVGGCAVKKSSSACRKKSASAQDGSQCSSVGAMCRQQFWKPASRSRACERVAKLDAMMLSSAPWNAQMGSRRLASASGVHE